MTQGLGQRSLIESRRSVFPVPAVRVRARQKKDRVALEDRSIDRRSYHLGIITAFAEVVSLGIKKLALSAPLSPEEYESIRGDFERVAAECDVKSHVEETFLVTDLFSEDIAEGKYVILLYCNDGVLDSYLALKKKKQQLAESGEYAGKARTELARDFGRLLSYPDDKIGQMLSERASRSP